MQFSSSSFSSFCLQFLSGKNPFGHNHIFDKDFSYFWIPTYLWFSWTHRHLVRDDTWILLSSEWLFLIFTEEYVSLPNLYRLFLSCHIILFGLYSLQQWFRVTGYILWRPPHDKCIFFSCLYVARNILPFLRFFYLGEFLRVSFLNLLIIQWDFTYLRTCAASS